MTNRDEFQCTVYAPTRPFGELVKGVCDDLTLETFPILGDERGCEVNVYVPFALAATFRQAVAELNAYFPVVIRFHVPNKLRLAV